MSVRLHRLVAGAALGHWDMPVRASASQEKSVLVSERRDRDQGWRSRKEYECENGDRQWAGEGRRVRGKEGKGGQGQLTFCSPGGDAASAPVLEVHGGI